jgi:GT2 family glycosyltransferase
MSSIDIVTFSTNRLYYLKKCIESIVYCKNDISNGVRVTHHVIFQGFRPTEEELSELARYNPPNYHFWRQNIGIGAGLNRILAELGGDLIIKFDEDAKFLTYDSLETLWKIHKAYPDSVFSPFVIGLQNNLGGVPGYAHEAYHDQEYDEYYMLRKVRHIGGIARCVPKAIYDGFTFKDDLDLSGRTSGDEDGQFSSYCMSSGIPMFYMDTKVVVEHQEGTLCQKLRYPDYYKDRQ